MNRRGERVARGSRAATRTAEDKRKEGQLCEGRGRRDRHGKRKGQALFLLRGNTIMLGEKKGARDGRKRTNLGAIVAASTTVENLAAHEGLREGADGRGRGMPRATVSLIKVSMMSVD